MKNVLSIETQCLDSSPLGGLIERGAINRQGKAPSERVEATKLLVFIMGGMKVIVKNCSVVR
jgi:hypothetical protein